MTKLKFNPDNKKYYSEEFIKGFECGVERQFEADKSELENILDKAKNEIFRQCKQINYNFSMDWNEGFNDGMFHTLTIINEILKTERGCEDDQRRTDENH